MHMQVMYESIMPYQDFAIRLPGHMIYRLPHIVDTLLADEPRVRPSALASMLPHAWLVHIDPSPVACGAEWSSSLAVMVPPCQEDEDEENKILACLSAVPSVSQNHEQRGARFINICKADLQAGVDFVCGV